jgi:hypothetical protein
MAFPLSWWRGANALDAQRALRMMELLNELRQGEGAMVTFCCDNPDFNGLPNCCVMVSDFWTDWEEREFRADTIEQCLFAAATEKRKVEDKRKESQQ